MGWTQAQQNQANEQIKNHFCSHHILARVSTRTVNLRPKRDS
eukprot:jgi/Antlo1/2217/790